MGLARCLVMLAGCLARGHEQSSPLEARCRRVDHGEWQARTVGYVEQRKRPVSQVESPQHCHADVGSVRMATDGTIEPAPAERRLALGLGVHENAVVFQDIDNGKDEIIGGRQVLGRDQLEIVC